MPGLRREREAMTCPRCGADMELTESYPLSGGFENEYECPFCHAVEGEYLSREEVEALRYDESR